MKSHERSLFPAEFRSLNLNLHARKQSLRQQVRAARVALSDRPARGSMVLDRLNRLPAYRQAESVLAFVGYRSEIATLPLIEERLDAGRATFVPWCAGDRLRLFRLDSLDDLAPGRFGILEPRDEVRESVLREVVIDTIDLILVPGLAYDRQGNRLGQGKGYYDRLLSAARSDAIRVGLGFDCQLVESVPTEPHDVALDIVVTESEIINCGKSFSADGHFPREN